MGKTMRRNKNSRALVSAIGAVTIACASGYSQTADALLNKLVEKGILSSKEAEELRREASQPPAKPEVNKTPIPAWVTSLKFGGDFRGRFDGIYASDPHFIDRDRFRYRLRYGVVATMENDFEVGFRVTSFDVIGNSGGNPVSNNSTLQGNGSKKFLGIDWAYARWSGLKLGDLTGSLTFGKMDNPFVFSNMIFDYDYTPEGFAGKFAYQVNDHHNLKLNLGTFALNELPSSTSDPYFFGAQVRWDASWTPKLTTSIGVAALSITSDENLSNSAVPDFNRGNTRSPLITGAVTNAVPAYGFNPIVADASVTYSLSSFPGYPGSFPIKVGGEFLKNPAAPSGNEAYNFGVTFGKAGRKGLWDLSYNWRYVGADAWYEEVVDDDFGAFYHVAPFGGVDGYQGGTNVKGHVVRASYSPFDAITLSVTWYRTQLINQFPANSRSEADRILVDAMWRF
jgi:hypothetical protein